MGPYPARNDYLRAKVDCDNEAIFIATDIEDDPTGLEDAGVPLVGVAASAARPNRGR
jgi:hypothetical protein